MNTLKLYTMILASATASLCAIADNGIFFTHPINISAKSEKAAVAENGAIRISYLYGGNDGKALGCSMQVKADGEWSHFISPLEDNKLFVITGPVKLKRPNYKSFYPAWTSADSISTNPYAGGSVCEAIPVNARNISKNSIEVEYVTSGDHKIKGVWTLAPGEMVARLSVEFTPAADGCYSIGLSGLHPALPSSVSNVLMPPMFQYHRLPEHPMMLLSAMMPQPAAMVETQFSGSPMTAFVSGDDSSFSSDWGSVDYSPMGFSLKNHDNLVQPVAFSPVLGMKDSKMKANVTTTSNFVVGLTPMRWTETLEYLSDNVYKVRDYRRQDTKSLTETIFNIVDLLNDDEAGGWSSSMKGPYDIEGKPTKAPLVVHCAPLAVIAAAVNAADEQMYIDRALPAIEYSLSRKGFRWSSLPTEEGYNKDPETLRLSPFGSQFTTSYFEGLNRLLAGRNKWISKIAIPDGELRVPKGYSTPILSWVQALYAYRLTGDEKWLRRAKSVAERDAKMHIYSNGEKPMRYQAFYNSSIYAPWWDFIDLYETTGDKQFLEAARYGAAHTLAGVRSWPPVSDSMMTIHPGGKYDGNTTMWWKGNEQFRLGFPRVDGDAPEHEVEQWRVSPVGLGFEQPSTYFLRNKGKLVRPVFMSSWAPSLLRLFQHTGRDIYNTYARNAVIGRFSNYPGYYATGYTDLTMSEDFPYKGPDISSIYYHHIPPHLAFSSDYLISELTQRAGGKISFPYSKQEGFVWFSSRIFGGDFGKIFNDNNVKLWMRKGLISIDKPEINFATAISKQNFWILLSNESKQAESFRVELSDEIMNLLNPSRDLAMMNAKGQKKKVSLNGNHLDLTVDANGFAALPLPVNANAISENSQLKPLLSVNEISELEDGFKVVDSGTEAGKIYTFRIRSPFGWDSIFGYCETPPAEGISVEVKCNDENISIDSYPFEWSFLKFEPDSKVSLEVNIPDKNGNKKSHNINI